MTTDQQHIETLVALPFRTHVERDQCNGEECYVAYHDDLKGCMAQGSTWREAVQALDDARRDYITASLSHGLQVPQPRPLRSEMRWIVVSAVQGRAAEEDGDPVFYSAPGPSPYKADVNLREVVA